MVDVVFDDRKAPDSESIPRLQPNLPNGFNHPERSKIRPVVSKTSRVSDPVWKYYDFLLHAMSIARNDNDDDAVQACRTKFRALLPKQTC